MMLKLFDRYVLKEILPPFLVGLLVYTFVLLMNQILLLSEMFISRGVSFRVVLLLLIYLLPSILSFTVPMSILMGILAGLSRMSSDAEIMAFKTLGISYRRLLRPVFVFSLGGWIITSLLTLYLSPHANYLWVNTLSHSVLTKVQFKINPREFNESIPNAVLFVQDISKDKSWKNIFVHFSAPPEEPRVVFAKKGWLNFYPREKRATLELFDGSVHSFPLANPEKYSVTTFQHLEEELDVENLFASIIAKKRVREKDIRELFRGIQSLNQDFKSFPESQGNSLAYRQKKREYVSHFIEVHKRIALPAACFIFALLGISLGASTKKGGRTSGFTLSIGIILLYYILITAGENLAMDDKIPAWLGMWAPNLLLALGGLYFFIKSLKESSLFPFVSRVFQRRERGALVQGNRGFKRSWPRLSLRFPNILDRYILRKFAAVFSLVFASALSIFIIVTFFERIDNVYEHNKTLKLFFEFIWSKTPEFVYFVLPVAALASTLLTLGLLTKFNEITAMKACGISLYRLILPVLLLGTVVSFLAFYVQENILPYSNKKAEEIWNKINDVPPRSYAQLDRQWVMGREGNRIYHYRYFDPIASTFSQLSIYAIDSSTWTLGSQIYAEKGDIKERSLFLSNVWMRRFAEGRPVEFEKNDLFRLNSVEDGSYFLKEWKVPDQMNYGELRKYISEIEASGFETVRFKVDLNYKTSFPLASFIMVLLGIPFAFSMGKRGTLVGIGFSIVIAMVYWGAIGMFKGLGYVNYLNAFLAAWGPNFIFGLTGLYLTMTLRT